MDLHPLHPLTLGTAVDIAPPCSEASTLHIKAKKILLISALHSVFYIITLLICPSHQLSPKEQG